MFNGHSLSISQTIFSPMGNVIVSGSKDNTIKFWDMVSGLCIRTIASHLGEVTSVDMSRTGVFFLFFFFLLVFVFSLLYVGIGTLLLSCSKDNSNRLWDIRSTSPLRRLKGHSNTSKNFVKACFAGDDAIVVGGSEVMYITLRFGSNLMIGVFIFRTDYCIFGIQIKGHSCLDCRDIRGRFMVRHGIRARVCF